MHTYIYCVDRLQILFTRGFFRISKQIWWICTIRCKRFIGIWGWIILRFSFRGVKFEISYLFLCLLILYIAFDKTGLYIPLILCIILHEISHLIFIIIFKSKVKSVKLILGAISIEYVDLYKRYKKIEEWNVLLLPLTIFENQFHKYNENYTLSKYVVLS